MSEVQELARTIVANRRLGRKLDEVAEAENEAGWGEWTDGYADQIYEAHEAVRAAGQKLFELTNVLIPEVGYRCPECEMVFDENEWLPWDSCPVCHPYPERE